MRKIIIKYALLSLLLCSSLFNTSCNDWLNVSPKADMKAEDLFSSETGFRDALIGIYASMSTTSLYGRTMTYGYIDVLAQYYNTPLKSTNIGAHSFFRAAKYEYTESGEESRINGIWGNHYKTIANVNQALEYIDKNKNVFSNDDVYGTYKAEFLSLRAFLHFNILRLFASSPKMNGGNGINTLAIPYVEKYTNIPQPQLSVKEVLNKIEGDLTAAKSLTRDKDIFGSKTPQDEKDINEALLNRADRMNYWAITALLSRVYLYGGKNSDALAQAKEIIGEANGVNPTAFELSTSIATTKDPMFQSEIIFGLDVQKLKLWNATYFSEVTASVTSILSMTNKAQKSMFDATSLDTEFREIWFVSTSNNASKLPNKFKDVLSIPMFKISELYLIAAETATSETEGAAYLNKLRAHRGLGQFNVADKLSTHIYKEYRREFICEGQLFFFYKRNVYSTIGAEDNSGIPEEKYNLPIPLNEQDFGNIKK